MESPDTLGNKSDLNEKWEKRILDSGADFVRFVDITSLSNEKNCGYPCAVLFGKALSREYICDVRDGKVPKTKEIFNTERRMDSLAEKVAQWIIDEGFNSLAKLRTGVLEHKTVALRAGLGFIGKNNLLITPEYGCALMLGRVLTDAPFKTVCEAVREPECAECRICTDACPTHALHGRMWSINVTRDEMLTRKLCNLCHRCMVLCPFTEKYAGEQIQP